MSRLCNSLLSLLLLFGIIACAPSSLEVVGETDEKQYQLAKSYQSQGRTDEALSAFLRVIDARRDAPESHFEAGYIYLEALKDPVSAIYHLKRYLQLKPGSPQASRVGQLIETAEKEFARQLPAGPYESELDHVDMLELLKGLRTENERLKQALVTAKQRLGQYEGMVSGARRATSATESYAALTPEPQVRQPQATPEPTDVPRSYKVQSGDTLSRISERFYGTPSRWADIYQANRDRLASENALRVGQEIRIP
jgi:tetratricopeptide (TPR) repeat protein